MCLRTKYQSSWSWINLIKSFPCAKPHTVDDTSCELSSVDIVTLICWVIAVHELLCPRQTGDEYSRRIKVHALSCRWLTIAIPNIPDHTRRQEAPVATTKTCASHSAGGAKWHRPRRRLATANCPTSQLLCQLTSNLLLKTAAKWRLIDHLTILTIDSVVWFIFCCLQ